jgi:hypothetical protein
MNLPYFNKVLAYDIVLPLRAYSLQFYTYITRNTFGSISMTSTAIIVVLSKSAGYDGVCSSDEVKIPV